MGQWRAREGCVSPLPPLKFSFEDIDFETHGQIQNSLNHLNYSWEDPWKEGYRQQKEDGTLHLKPPFFTEKKDDMFLE